MPLLAPFSLFLFLLYFLPSTVNYPTHLHTYHQHQLSINSWSSEDAYSFSDMFTLRDNVPGILFLFHTHR